MNSWNDIKGIYNSAYIAEAEDQTFKYIGSDIIVGKEPVPVSTRKLMNDYIKIYDALAKLGALWAAIPKAADTEDESPLE